MWSCSARVAAQVVICFDWGSSRRMAARDAKTRPGSDSDSGNVDSVIRGGPTGKRDLALKSRRHMGFTQLNLRLLTACLIRELRLLSHCRESNKLLQTSGRRSGTTS